jgi:hypothetical protein
LRWPKSFQLERPHRIGALAGRAAEEARKLARARVELERVGLERTALFGAVVTVGFVGMVTTDRQLASSTCAECSQGAGSGDRGSGDDIAAILRE